MAKLSRRGVVGGLGAAAALRPASWEFARRVVEIRLSRNEMAGAKATLFHFSRSISSHSPPSLKACDPVVPTATHRSQTGLPHDR